MFSIFGHRGSEADDIMYINWLNMLRAGLLGLEFYTPETKKWRQVFLVGVFIEFNLTTPTGSHAGTLCYIESFDGMFPAHF